MQLVKKTFALYASVASTLIYAACSVFVALFPDFSTNLMASLFHIPSAIEVGSRVTFRGAATGAAEVAIYSLIIGWIFAWIFNRSVRNN